MFKNFWYAVEFSADVQVGTPSKVKVLGQQLVIYRKPSDGTVVAMSDLCVHRGAALYPGEFAGRLPDLIFELDPSIAARSEPARSPYGEHAGPYPDHSLEGIWITSGPHFARSVERGRVSVFDLAPTVLALLGLPVYTEMSGKVRSELFLEALPPRFIEERDDPAARRGYRPGPEDYDAKELEEVKSRLKETGYAQ